jgi:hypothetical protein
MKKIPVGFSLFLVVLLSSCDLNESPPPCPAVFTLITVQVKDELGQGVSGVNVTVTLERTGEILDMGREYIENGSYVIADDSIREKFSVDGDVLAVSGSKDSKTFQAQFEIRQGVCNIEKISGPEVVTLK